MFPIVVVKLPMAWLWLHGVCVCVCVIVHDYPVMAHVDELFTHLFVILNPYVVIFFLRNTKGSKINLNVMLFFTQSYHMA